MCINRYVYYIYIYICIFDSIPLVFGVSFDSVKMCHDVRSNAIELCGIYPDKPDFEAAEDINIYIYALKVQTL